jgi:crotonobetainyl-CoA:carnitine CoA-transferase CaiB-like acyl-CoA transferase
MTRPFEGIRIIDITHVLAGPFAAYQLAVLGADVIKVEHPEEPDQSREGGTDRALNRRNMGTSFLTQGSNKQSITLNLKTEEGREILKKLVARSDVLVENYRPGAFEALGLGYEAMTKINPRLIYCSISAFGQDGVRREQTAYDHVIQATSGIMASTGTEEVNPIKIDAPAIDYATGTMGAFALASALFQRERTGKGQHIDLAMLGVAMMMQASLVTGYFRNGTEPRPHGNKQPFATNSAYDAKEGMVMIGASNIRQQARFWRAVERPDMIKTHNEARIDDREREAAISSRPRPPTSGRSISRRAMCRRRGCGRWPKPSPTRISKIGAYFTILRTYRVPMVRWACRWPRSSSRMEDRRSSTRRTRWGKIPAACSRSSASMTGKSRVCANRALSNPLPLSGPLIPRADFKSAAPAPFATSALPINPHSAPPAGRRRGGSAP